MGAPFSLPPTLARFPQWEPILEVAYAVSMSPQELDLSLPEPPLNVAEPYGTGVQHYQTLPEQHHQQQKTDITWNILWIL